MVGMTTTGTATVSGHDGRSVIIDVTGVARQDIAKTSNYQVKVPYSQINASIRNITRLGGTVSRVQVVGVGTASGDDRGETSPATGESPSADSANKTAARKPAPTKSRRGRRGKSNR